MRRLMPLLAGLWLALLAQAHAETFHIGVELQPYMPYSDVQEGQYQGYGRELLDAFAAHQGYVFVYQPLPVRRLLSEFLNGKVDFKYPDHPRWNADLKQAHQVYFSQATAPSIDGVLVKPQRLGAGKEGLKRLGTQRGFTPWPYLDDIKAGRILLVQANKIDSLVAMALNDRVDGVYLNPQVVKYRLRNSPEENALVFDRSLAYQNDHYLLSSIKHPQVIEQFDAFLTRQAALVQALKDRHGIRDPLSSDQSCCNAP